MLVPPKIMQLAKLADNESSRYALGGIRFERCDEGRPYAVATDGRKLARVTWSEDDKELYPACAGFYLDHVNGFETVLSSKDCTEAAKLPPKRTPKPILENIVIDESANGTLNYGATDIERTRLVQTRPLEGRYPRWRDVVTNPARIVIVPDKDHKPIDYSAAIDGEAVNGGEDSINGFPVVDPNAPIALAELTSGDYVEICVDPAYLAELCKVAESIACGDDNRGVTLQIPCDQSSPVRLVKKYNGVDFVGVLMPLSCSK